MRGTMDGDVAADGENKRGENQRGQMYSIILGVKISGRFVSVEMICSYCSVCTRGSHAVSLRHGNGERWVCDWGGPARARIRWKSSQ